MTLQIHIWNIQKLTILPSDSIYEMLKYLFFNVHQIGAKALEEKLVQKLPGATSGWDVWHAALRLLSAFLSKSLISIHAASAPSISVPLSCFDVVLIYLRKSQICVICKRKRCGNKPSPEPLMCTDPGSQNVILGFI